MYILFLENRIAKKSKSINKKLAQVEKFYSIIIV